LQENRSSAKGVKNLSKDNSKFSVSEVIDSFGVNKFTWLIFIFLGAAMVFDGYDYMIVSYTMAAIKSDWGLTAIQSGSLTSWSLIGLVIGGAISGILSDKFGRKKTLSFAIAIYSLLTVPIFFSQNFTVFAIFRVLAGVGLGACIPIVTTVFSESTPTKKRALFITFGMAWMIVGWVIAGLIGTALVPRYGWRVCYLLGGIPFLYSIFLFFKMPESIYWLAGKGRNEEAVKGLQRIEQYATGKKTDWDPKCIIIPPKAMMRGPKALFSKKFRIATAGVWITYFCGSFIVYGINAWLPYLMAEKGFSPATAIVNNAAAILANCSAGFVAEAIGRKKNVIMGYLVAALGICFIAFAGNSFVIVIIANIFMGFAMNYAITCVQPVMAESYPTEFRNTGVAWCQAFGRFGGALGPIVAGSVIGLGLGYSTSFLFYIIPALVGALGAFLFIRNETKGKSLDQLANEKQTQRI
jgi:AAHS family 4-hydroxybenzoate transporter-like MFS transporter